MKEMSSKFDNDMDEISIDLVQKMVVEKHHLASAF